MPAPRDERLAVVTGAANGIGRACAEALLAGGCRVVALDRDEAALAALAAAHETLPRRRSTSPTGRRWSGSGAGCWRRRAHPTTSSAPPA